MELERSVPSFRGVNNVGASPGAIASAIAEAFNTLIYQKLTPQASPQPSDRTYTDNERFWEAALHEQHFESMRVALRGFHITEWLPAAPGRYFTPEARQQRKDAEGYLVYDSSERYLLPGKGRMVLGGIGSIRLKAKSIESSPTYFLGASSTGITHQGIPLALPEPGYREVIQLIKQHGGCYANIVGSLRVLTPAISVIHYDADIPRYCIFVEDIEIIRPSSRHELLATVSIMFGLQRGGPSGLEYLGEGGYTTTFDKLWSFCSFDPSVAGNVHRAVDWLKEYMRKYTRTDDSPVLSDFDEHYSHFDSPVEFPLAQLALGNFDVERLHAYQRRFFVRQGYASFTIQDDRLRSVRQSIFAFLSYRRADSSAAAGRIFDHLTQVFGAGSIYRDVDMDVDVMPPGRDFRERIAQVISTAKVLLVLIGPQWVHMTDENGVRRLNNPNDVVRQEVELALQRGIPVIPVLLDGTPMPKPEDLPPNLVRLRTHQGISVRNSGDFPHDLDRLIRALVSIYEARDNEVP